MLLLREYGTLPLRDVLGYAIGYAEPAATRWLPAISWGIASVADLFRDHWPSSAEVYLPGGGVPAAGLPVRQPRAGRHLPRILAEAEAAGSDRDEQIEAARQVCYEGFVAETIAAVRLYRGDGRDRAAAPRVSSRQTIWPDGGHAWRRR